LRRHRSGDTPTNALRTLLAAATLVGAAASSTAVATLSVVNQGKNVSVQSEEGYTGNIVGGGAVRVTDRGET
jgi:hypothetical protein